jgi:hypothetical protein
MDILEMPEKRKRLVQRSL